MAVPITITNIPATRYVVPTSRYANNQVILWGNKGILTFNLYKRHTYVPNANDKFYIIPAGEEYRPDKTSVVAYNTPDYWWKIMESNNIFDVYDYKSGLTIRIPAVTNF